MTDKEKAEKYAHREIAWWVDSDFDTDMAEGYIKRAYLDGLAEGRKENAELKEEIESLKKTYKKQRNKRIDELQKENAELKEQIEKMKCCGNCKHYEIHTTKEGVKYCLTCRQLDKNKEKIIYPKWEMYE